MIKYIVNCRLIDKYKDTIEDIKISDGKIVGFGNFKEEANKNIIDAKGMVVMPAFIDLHVHFRDPGFTYKEDLESGSIAALRGGYTAVNLMANTNPVCDNIEIYQDIISRGKDLNLIDISSVITVSRNLEGNVMTDFKKFPKSLRFVSEDGKGVMSSMMMYNTLLECKKRDIGIMVHAEDMDISHIDYRIAEDLNTIRDIYLSKVTKGYIHFSHVSTKGSIEAIRDGKREKLNITCEVTPHHISLFDNEYRVNPPIRKREDVEALIEAIKDGTVDAIATDHAPHTKEEKIKGAPGMVGLETSFSIVNKIFKENNISLNKLSELMSFNPAKILRLNKGVLEKGYDADLVIVDIEKDIIIDSSKFISKSNNTAFDKYRSIGEILMTIRNGEVMYNKEEDFDNR